MAPVHVTSATPRPTDDGTVTGVRDAIGNRDAGRVAICGTPALEDSPEEMKMQALHGAAKMRSRADTIAVTPYAR